ncbi:MAG: V-type ATPase subunit [Thermodesulfovibrionales bacterium]|jgi:vacuolar-type H+-ATPase subunit C/Vma6|nr:V-type ATPase subunit [Thermodesulfovibrionales bacterium]
MEIFERIEDRGYPTDYLLSRVRSRRMLYRNFIAGESPVEIWRRLLKEYRWIYIQMNETLRNIFQRFFIYFELRTIFMCLRYKKGEYEKIEELLYFSLLSDDLKELLMGSDIMTAIGGVGDAFLSISDRFVGLKETFIKDGLRGLEQELTNVYLENTIDSKLHHTIKDFFRYIIDSRNIIAVYKHIRWQMHDYPSFVNGGSVREARLRRIFERRDISGITTLVQKLTGIMTDAGNIENSLLKRTTRFLRKAARDPLCIGVILDHLWKCYVETIEAEMIH